MQHSEQDIHVMYFVLRMHSLSPRGYTVILHFPTQETVTNAYVTTPDLAINNMPNIGIRNSLLLSRNYCLW